MYLATGTTDVVVIGGSISGTAAAYELARPEAEVTLLAQGSLASTASSWTLGVRRPVGIQRSDLWQPRWSPVGSSLIRNSTPTWSSAARITCG